MREDLWCHVFVHSLVQQSSICTRKKEDFLFKFLRVYSTRTEGQTQDLMAATPEAGARAARTRAQWMSAVKRSAFKREYEDEDPLDDEENEEV